MASNIFHCHIHIEEQQQHYQLNNNNKKKLTE